MLVSLLFAVAVIGDNPAEIVPPPPPPPVVVTVAAPKPAPTVIKVETVTVTQQLNSPTVIVEDVETVTFDTGDGVTTTDRATYDKLVVTAARGETDEEYDARLYAQYYAAKPWMCGS